MPRFKYNSKRYQEWRQSVFLRDKYTCKLCGSKGGRLNAHHIIRKADKPSLVYKKYNGITLCYVCHKIVTENEKLFEKLFTLIVNKKLTSQYVIKIFDRIFKQNPEIIIDFKKTGRWLKIADYLNKLIQRFNDKRRK